MLLCLSKLSILMFHRLFLQLGGAGATVYVTGRKPSDLSKPSALEATAKEITARGGRGVPVYCDHSSLDDVEGLFK